MTNFKFEGKEVEILQGVMGAEVEAMSNRIKEKVDGVFKLMRDSRTDPETRLAEIASQEKWDRKSYAGDCWFTPNLDARNAFVLGFQESTFSNLFYHFGFHSDNQMAYIFPCIILVRVMKENKDVYDFVRTVLDAAWIVQKVKSGLSWKNIFIARLLVSLLENDVERAKNINVVCKYEVDTSFFFAKD